MDLFYCEHLSSFSIISVATLLRSVLRNGRSQVLIMYRLGEGENNSPGLYVLQSIRVPRAFRFNGH